MQADAGLVVREDGVTVKEPKMPKPSRKSRREAKKIYKDLMPNRKRFPRKRKKSR